MIKQAADYVKAGLPEAVQKAYKAVLSNGANDYITEAAWEAASADIVEALSEAINVQKDGYLAGTNTLATDWNKYDYVYAASKLYTGYDYTALAAEFAKDNDASAVKAAKAQFKLDLTDAMAVYDKVDLAALYSKTEPTTGKTYYEQAADALAANKEALNDFYYAKDGSVQQVGDTVSAVKNEITAVKGWIKEGYTGTFTLIAVKAENYEGTNVAKYYYVEGIKTIDSAKVDDAIDAAKTAAIKAQVAKNVALFLQNHKATEDKTFAENYTTLYNYLADKIPAVSKLSTDVVAHETIMNDVKDSHAALIANAIEAVEGLETYAAKYAAEKDATGALVRDTAEVNKLVEKAKTYVYANAVGIADASIPVYTIDEAKRDIAAMTTSGDAAKLAFDKEAEKADLNDYMNGVTTGAGFVATKNYYDLEAEQVKAAYEAAKAKVDAVAKASDFVEIETALKKDLAKINDKNAVNNLFASGKMATELDKQADALVAYVTYKNAALNGKTYEDAYVLGGDKTNATKLLKDYFIEKNARTVAEMQALTTAVEDVAAKLPTNAALSAAKKAAQDAIKALPSAAKVTSADKAAYQAAFDLAKTYNDMAEKAGVQDSVAIAAGNITALQNAIQADFQLAYAKADKTDKAALKTIAADVKAANDEVGTDKMFTTKFTDPTVADLAKIRQKEKDAVIAAINAIPMNVTEADKETVKKARELYDAFIAEYTDYDLGKAQNDAGYVAKEFEDYYHDLALAEAALGLNTEDPAMAVKAFKIKASSKATKGAMTIKWKLIDGDKSAAKGYQVWRSTKANKGFKKMITTKKMTYKNTKNLKKGTTYYYRVRAYARTAEGKLVFSDFSNKAYRKAK